MNDCIFSTPSSNQDRMRTFCYHAIHIFSCLCFRTYTNDTGFVEEEDQEIIENFTDASHNIDIEVMDGVRIEELNDISGNDIDTIEQVQDTATNDTLEYRYNEEICSEYTDEMPLRNTDTVPNNVTTVESVEQRQKFRKPNTSSQNSTLSQPSSSKGIVPSLTRVEPVEASQQFREPTINSFQNSALSQPSSSKGFISTLPRDNSLTHRTVSALREGTTETAVNPPTIVQRHNSSQPSSKQQMQSLTSSQNQRQTTSSSHRNANSSTRTGPGLTTSTSATVSTSTKEKSLEAIRHKMDSCLTAIANKVSDKAQRSPHAPFLAYLGTKLPNIPKEKIQDVEKEILELVDYYSVRD